MDNKLNNFNNLALKVKTHGDNESYAQLSGQYYPMCHKIIEKYKTSLQQRGMIFQDFTDKIPLLIFNACSSFDPSKASFSTHLHNVIRYDCLNNINTNINRSTIRNDIAYIEIENSKNDLTSVASFSFNEDYNKILEQLKSLEDKRIFKVFKLRFLGDKIMSFKEIGKKMEISSQTAFTLYNKGLKLLKMKNNVGNQS